MKSRDQKSVLLSVVLTYAALLVISQIKSRFSKNDLNIVNDGRKEPIHTKEARADRNQGVFNVVKIMFLPFPSKSLYVYK